MEVDYDSMRYHVAGINHMAWFLKLSLEGEDIYPRLKACLENPEVVSKDPVRFEIMKHFDYFVTESSTHMAEYVPYFMRHPEEMERLNIRSRARSAERSEDILAQRKEEQKEKQMEIQKPAFCFLPTRD